MKELYISNTTSNTAKNMSKVPFEASTEFHHLDGKSIRCEGGLESQSDVRAGWEQGFMACLQLGEGLEGGEDNKCNYF